MLDTAYPIDERTLPNGLRVVVSEDHSVPTVTVNLWVGVGSRNEVPGRTGFAHLFEHLMFQGSANVASGEHFSLLMAEGASMNATTWFDRTNYFETVPTGAFELALWLEADRHGRLLEAVNQANLDNQRDVVKEEKRQRYDNVPYGTAMIDVYATIFPPGHPYHHPTIGSMEDLDAASVEDVHEFFRRWYGPNNTVLTIVGDVSPTAAFEAAERHFGELPASATPAATPATRPARGLAPLTQPARLDRSGAVPNDRLHIAFRLPVDNTHEYLACALALDAIGGLSTSRLVERLVREESTCTSIGAHSMGLVDGASLGFITADVSQGADPAAVEAAIIEELEAFSASGPTEFEMEAALAETERSWLSALSAQDDRADTISQFTLLHGDPNLVNSFLTRTAAVTASDVQQAAATWLRPSSRAVVAYLTAAPEELPA